MSKKRDRNKQTVSLEERLSQFTNGLQNQAKNLESNSAEALELQKRISKSDTARINASLIGTK